MGITGGGDLLFSLKSVAFSQLFAIASSRAEKNGRSVPKVDIDANWLLHMYSKGRSSIGIIVEIVSAFVQEGFAVSVLFDGDIRHHSKVESIRRRTKAEYGRINGISAKGTVMQLSQRLQSGQYKDNDEKNHLAEKLHKEENYLKKCEKGASSIISPEYYDVLKEAIKEIVDTTNKGGSIAMVEKALHEADYAICYRVVRGETDIVLANDCDYKVAAGDACLAISKFKYESRTKTINNIMLTSGSRTTIENAASAAGIVLDNNNYKAAAHPLLETASPALRALIAVGLGCDSLPGGVGGVAVKGISTFLEGISNNNNEETANSMSANTEATSKVASTAPSHTKTAETSTAKSIQSMPPTRPSVTGDSVADRLLEWYAEVDKKKRSQAVIWTCAQAILYQPGNIISVSSPLPLLYLHGPPPSPLPKYLQEYNSNPYAVAEDDPETGVCQGNGICGRHLYLKEDGVITCSSCKDVFCRHCVKDRNARENSIRKDNKESLLPPDMCCTMCCSARIHGSNKEQINVGAMKEKLAELNYSDNDLSPSEIMHLYETVVEEKSTDFYSADIESMVKLPLLPAESLEDGTINTILSFDFEEGARVMRNEVLSTNQLIQLTDLFASLVRFDPDPPEKLGRLAKVLPKIMIDFANESRADDGLRLMERCIRHAMDSKTSSLINARASIFHHNGEVGLLISHTMQPSFKDAKYDTTIAFTKSAIVACACSCKAGADCKKKDQKNVDVHVLPVMHLLVLLLFDGLAEHILIELAPRWKAVDDGVEDSETMMDAIDTLKVAARRPISKGSVLTERPSDATVTKLLDSFLVGTERPKKTPAPPHPRALCPLAAQKTFVSYVKKAEDVIANRSGSDSTSTLDHFAEARKQGPYYNHLSSDPESTDYTSNKKQEYFRIMCMVSAWTKALPSNDKSHKDPVGYKLLALRSKEEGNEGVKDIVEKEMRSQIRMLTQKQKERKQNSGRRKGSSNSSLASSTNSSTKHTVAPKRLPIRKSYPTVAKYTRYCCFPGCGKRGTKSEAKGFRSIPSFPSTLPADASDARKMTYAKKKFIREENLRRCSYSTKCTTKLYICRDHLREDIKKAVSFTNGKGERRSFTASLNVPVPVGRLSVRLGASGNSRGLGSDRNKLSLIETAKKAETTRIAATLNVHIMPHLPQLPKSAVARISLKLAEDTVSWKLSSQNQAELHEKGDVSDINSSIASATGIADHIQKADTPLKRTITELPSRPLSPNSGETPKKKQKPGDMPPVVDIETVTDGVVRNHTGFKTLLGMLIFITIACNGDLATMMHTTTSLTWFEEWFLYFEMVWGRAVTNWSLAEEKYGIHRDRLAMAFNAKLQIILSARALWPMFVTVEEDMKLRRDKYSLRYKDKQTVFWDTTNINLPKPTDADLQRLTWSHYYNGNVGKGGVFAQLCGWIGTFALWTGAVSDTDYLGNAGILEMQKQYAAEFAAKSGGKENPFVNIVDKGFRSIITALRAGRQLILQPFFAKSDEKFNTHQVLTSAAIAADRAGNERAVDVSKRAGMLSRGIRPSESIDRTCKVWLAWSFQANFMNKSVM